jgi:hypothetical protein
MKNLKGKDTFTSDEISRLEDLIKLRLVTPASEQKTIRQKMRKIGFYGRDDWGIIDMQLSDLKRLIDTGKIKVIGSNIKTPALKSQTEKRIHNNKETKLSNTDDLQIILSSFHENCFNPSCDNSLKIPNQPGNYIICLQEKSSFPKVSISPVLTKFLEYEVIYTGIAGTSLRTRDYRQHFEGNNAGRSTLRKSLGALFGYKQVPRDKDPTTGKTKFNESDERELSEWMKSNLLMFYYPNSDFLAVETELINIFNPPLNLQGNSNSINANFRLLLSTLRCKKQ